jgi:rare lipoprotein A
MRKRGRMRSVSYRVLGLGLGMSLGLAACMDATTSTERAGAAQSGNAVIERDVEDPSIFSRNDAGLWDGRPSLGGVWVAHPDARAPERVIIRNGENGRQTVGVLFRRERLNPGPAFQISAEAANAIGVLAGAPTQLQVVALRSDDAATTATTSTATTNTGAPAPEDQTVAALQAAAPASTSAPEGETLIAMPAESAPPRAGLFSRMFRRDQSASAPAEFASPAPEIQQTALAEPATVASAPPAPASAPAAATSAPASALERPFIQLGIFSVESNAANAQRMATAAGLSARVVEGRTQANAFWRVVVGPAQSAAQHAQMLAQVKALGFSDAYAVRR